MHNSRNNGSKCRRNITRTTCSGQLLESAVTMESEASTSQNPPPKGKRPCRGVTAAELKNINAYPLLAARQFSLRLYRGISHVPV